MKEVPEDIASAEALRPELSAYCYRMLGSIFEADDAVQDTLIRAWQNWDRFRRESSRRTWIYRIATNVCLDRLRGAKRRALPMDLSGPAERIMAPRETQPVSEWIWPAPDTLNDPAEAAVRRDTVRLAFLALLQTLPPRQRAVIILQDVFQWPASRAAEATGMSAAAVNSALQRARSAMARANLRSDAHLQPDADLHPQLLDRYVDAFERYDIDSLLSLFLEDGSLSMPPFAMWVRGRADLAAFYEVTRDHCRGSRLLPVRVFGQYPACAQYAPAAPAGTLKPWAIHVLETQGGRIAHLHTFIDPALFPRFGLPTDE